MRAVPQDEFLATDELVRCPLQTVPLAFETIVLQNEGFELDAAVVEQPEF